MNHPMGPLIDIRDELVWRNVNTHNAAPTEARAQWGTLSSGSLRVTLHKASTFFLLLRMALQEEPAQASLHCTLEINDLL